MGARKSRRSRSVAADQNRYGISRPVRTRQVLPVIVVVCDDAKTACNYFEVIKREVKSKITVHVIEAPCHGATADDVLKAADHQRKSLKDSSAHSREDRSSVWALIDTEVEPHRVSAAHDAKKKAESKGVKTALSKPCFEVWTLAHLADTGEAFSGCSAVLQKVKSAWKAEFQSEFAKPQADYAKLAILRHKAASRAKARTPDKDQSWTEVYKVVEEIDALFNQPEGSQNIP